MKRENLKNIIINRSAWKIDKRRGDYALPNGTRLSSYLYDLIDSQLEVDGLGIAKDGSLCVINRDYFPEWDKYMLMPGFRDDEPTNYSEQEARIKAIVRELLY